MFSLSFFTGGIAATNGWLLSLEDRHWAVDAPEGMADWISARNVRLEALWITHQHFDHVMDAAAIQQSHGCPLIAHSPYSTSLTLERLFGAVSGSSMTVPAFDITETVGKNSSVLAGDQAFSVFHIPGHSPDSICFHSEDLGLVFGGDVLFEQGIGRTDFPGGSTETLLSGIAEHLLPLTDETRVLPGHGAETTIGAERSGNPFLTSL